MSFAPTKQLLGTGIRQLSTAFRRHPLVFGGAVLIAFLAVTALAAQWVAPYDPIEQVLPDRLLSPSFRHWMGTDQFGRDVFSRLIYGSRISLAVVMLAVSIYVFIGNLV